MLVIATVVVLRYEDDSSQEIDFSVSGRDFPIERFQEGMKIIIKHLESGEERELKINFQDFKTSRLMSIMTHLEKHFLFTSLIPDRFRSGTQR